MNFSVEVEREDDGRWIAEVLELPGVLVYGQTREEAISKWTPRAKHAEEDNPQLGLIPFIDLTDEQFFELYQNHELIRFERNTDSTLVLYLLFGGINSIRSANLCGQLGKWNRDDKLGVAFSSSAGFTLPNGA